MTTKQVKYQDTHRAIYVPAHFKDFLTSLTGGKKGSLFPLLLQRFPEYLDTIQDPEATGYHDTIQQQGIRIPVQSEYHDTITASVPEALPEYRDTKTDLEPEYHDTSIQEGITIPVQPGYHDTIQDLSKTILDLWDGVSWNIAGKRLPEKYFNCDYPLAYAFLNKLMKEGHSQPVSKLYEKVRTAKKNAKKKAQ